MRLDNLLDYLKMYNKLKIDDQKSMNNMQNQLQKELGYTLVELSIVILIIGFLIAGISSATGLVKQATLRSVVSELSNNVVAYNNFVGRYNKTPGDMDNAYSYWTTNCAATAANCNGNGNGIINHSSTSVSADEVNKAWNHLYNAAMLANTTIQPVTTQVTALQTMAPTSKITGAGYYMVGGVDSVPFASNINAVFVGKPLSGDTLLNGALSANDAHAIDIKVDDGNFDNASPANPIGATTGFYRAVTGASSASGTCTNATTPNIYTLSNTGLNCRLGLALHT